MVDKGTSSVATRHLLQQEGWRRDNVQSLLRAHLRGEGARRADEVALVAPQ